MAGAMMITPEAELKRYESVLEAGLAQKAVTQGIVDSVDEVVVRDILPMTDLASGTTGATSSSAGYRSDEWRIDMRTYQSDGSTASAANAFNQAVNVNLNKEKVVGVLGIKKHGEDAVASVRFSLGSGAKIKDIWHLDTVNEDQTYWGKDIIVYNSNSTMKVEYYLKAPAIINLAFVGKVSEAKGDTILGAE